MIAVMSIRLRDGVMCFRLQIHSSAVAVFVKSSYKRMDTWNEVVEQEVGPSRLKRLKLIGETRWAGKVNAAKSIFGGFETIDVTTFVHLVVCLFRISTSSKFARDPKVKHEAHSLLQNFLKFETILLAFTFLRLFSVISPLSLYLQTSRLDFVKAWNYVQATTEALEEYSRTFQTVEQKAESFVSCANEHLERVSRSNFSEDETSLFEDVVVESHLPDKRIRKRKMMPGELARDETGDGETPIDTFSEARVQPHS